MTRWDADGAFGLLSGCAAVVGTAGLAAAVFGPGEPVARLVVLSAAVAGVTALTRDWRAGAGVTVLAVLIFVGFLAGRDGVLTGHPAAWAAAPVLVAAALLGRARRLPGRRTGRIARGAVAHRLSGGVPSGGLPSGAGWAAGTEE